MRKVTDQSFFDKTIKHFVKQGTQSVDYNSYIGSLPCKYRSKAGLSCALGCHIPDSKYNPLMDAAGGMNASKLLGNYPELQQYIPNLDLATDMQMIHDGMANWESPAKMVTQLKWMARKYNLNTRVLDKLDFSHIKPGTIS